MKLIRYILLTLLLPVFPAGAQNLCGSRVQVANPSILIGDNGRVMIGMDVTLPADMQLSSNRVATLTPVLKTRDNSYNKVLPSGYMVARVVLCSSVSIKFLWMPSRCCAARTEHHRR